MAPSQGRGTLSRINSAEKSPIPPSPLKLVDCLGAAGAPAALLDRACHPGQPTGQIPIRPTCGLSLSVPFHTAAPVCPGAQGCWSTDDTRCDVWL